jgi:NAD(P)-dependent dehydrogenase (short-subunit alcohol dehydrogenase family)
MPMDLEGKIALVTGSARRLGHAIALAMARRGCHLMIHFHRSAQEAEDTVAEVSALGVRVTAVQADLSQAEGIQALFQALDQAYGGLDLLVNSAAIMERGDLLEVSQEDWRRTIDLNLRGVFFCLQQAAKRMRQRGGGAIVNISDVAALQPWKRYPVHSISKAGVEMLTKVAALALAPEIRVNAIAPGLILRPEFTDQKRWEKLAQALPLGREGAPSDVVNAVIFLLENQYITGETLVVDGGRLLV